MKKPKFKSGTRVKFIKGGRKGRIGIVMGTVRRSHFEAYKIGLVGRWDDPYDQQYWLEIRADFLEYESAIDKLGDVLDEADLEETEKTSGPLTYTVGDPESQLGRRC